jgi:hypothetical protein
MVETAGAARPAFWSGVSTDAGIASAVGLLARLPGRCVDVEGIHQLHPRPEEHRQRVGALADKLRTWGVDCEIDQYEMSPPGGWAQWSERKIEESDFVLIVCTKSYRQRFMGEERKGIGLGGRWEGWIIRQEIYESAQETGKFVPVLVDAADEQNIPPPLRGRTYFTPSDSEDLHRAYRLITNQPNKERPSLGTPVALEQVTAAETSRQPKSRRGWILPRFRSPGWPQR